MHAVKVRIGLLLAAIFLMAWILARPEVREARIRAHHAAAALDYRQGKLAEAEAEWRAAIALDPSLLIPHCRLGALLAVQGRFEEAEAELRTSLAIHPDLTLRRNLVSVLIRRGDLASLEREATMLLAMDRTDWYAYDVLATIAIQREDFASAREFYRDCLLNMSPGFSRIDALNIRRRLASVLMCNGELDAAEIEAREVVREASVKGLLHHPRLRAAELLLGEIEERLNKPQDAIKAYEHVAAAPADAGLQPLIRRAHEKLASLRAHAASRR